MSGPICSASAACSTGSAQDGRRPRGGEVGATVGAGGPHDPPGARELPPSVPPSLAELIHRRLAKSPADRPASAAEVAAALRDVAQNRAVPMQRGFGRRRRALLA